MASVWRGESLKHPDTALKRLEEGFRSETASACQDVITPQSSNSRSPPGAEATLTKDAESYKITHRQRVTLSAVISPSAQVGPADRILGEISHSDLLISDITVWNHRHQGPGLHTDPDFII